MGITTAIEWTDATHNFWSGCAKVTAGCDHCYAERLMQRFGRDFGTVTRAPDKRFSEPLKWERDLVARARGAAITPRRVFTSSMSDFFHPAADAWRDDSWAVIRQTPHLHYQILTKRPNRIARCLPADWGERGYPNVWLGVTVESAEYLWRLRYLYAVPATVRFVSCEPLLGPIDLSPHLFQNYAADDPRYYRPGERGMDWVITGGESGGPAGRRLVEKCPRAGRPWPAEPCPDCGEPRCTDTGWVPKHDALAWVRAIRDQCQAAGTAYLHKQWGGPTPKSAGRLLDGRVYHEYPDGAGGIVEVAR